MTQQVTFQRSVKLSNPEPSLINENPIIYKQYFLLTKHLSQQFLRCHSHISGLSFYYIVIISFKNSPTDDITYGQEPSRLMMCDVICNQTAPTRPPCEMRNTEQGTKQKGTIPHKEVVYLHLRKQICDKLFIQRIGRQLKRFVSNTVPLNYCVNNSTIRFLAKQIVLDEPEKCSHFRTFLALKGIGWIRMNQNLLEIRKN